MTSLSGWINKKVDKIREGLTKLYELYTERYGKWRNVDNLDILEKWFEEAEKLIETMGGKVIEKHIAPNGYISFECDGEIWSADLVYGFYKIPTRKEW